MRQIRAPSILSLAQGSLQIGTTPTDIQNIAWLSRWFALWEGNSNWLWIFSYLALMFSFAISMRLWQHLRQAVEISSQNPTSSFLRSHPLPEPPHSKFTGFLSYKRSCAWLKSNGDRSLEETFQQVLPWSQKMARAASSEERQLDREMEITLRCSAQCCSLQLSVLTHTTSLCFYQCFKQAFFSPLTFCSLWHVRSHGLQHSLQKWRNIC